MLDIAELAEGVQDGDLPLCGQILFTHMVQSAHVLIGLLMGQKGGILINESLEATSREQRHSFSNFTQGYRITLAGVQAGIANSRHRSRLRDQLSQVRFGSIFAYGASP